MELIDVINQIIDNNMKGKDLTDYKTGTVTSVNPLKVRVQENIQDISEPLLIIPDYLKSRQISVSGTFDITLDGENKTALITGGSVTIPAQLKIGDKVSLLKVNDGQNFFVLSR